MQLPPLGSRIEDRYEVRERLGRGNFAVVVRAHDHHMSRDVALKLLTPDPDADRQRVEERFQKEVRAIAGLQHPGIVRLFDFGQTGDGVLYIAFEYIDGETVKQLIARRDLIAPDEALDIVRQVLEALVEVHASGIAHSDIKPANIALRATDSGHQVKLLDFGLARFSQPMNGLWSRTRSGGPIGTPRYMAPEQFAGRSATPSSDLFAVGLLAIELVAGSEAMRCVGEGARSAGAREPSHRSVLNKFPSDVRRVIRAMTRRRRADRPADAVTALRELAR